MHGSEGVDSTQGGLSVLLTWILALAAFGPYLVSGVRTDNALTWLVAPVAVWAALTLRLPRRAWLVLAAWVLLLGTATISHILPTLNTSPYLRGSALAGIDAFVSPLVVLLVGIILVKKVGGDRVFTIVSGVLGIGMAGNALLALAQWASPTARLLIGRFWGLSLQEDSTLVRAAAQDRFSGIMQQPALAGAMYGIALIVVTHLFARRPVIRDVLWVLLLVGGALCASKAFWFVGVPIAIGLRILLIRTMGSRDGWKSLLVFAPIASLAILLGVSIGGIGQSIWSALEELFQAATSGVAGVTGNRFGEGGVILQLASHVFADAPVAGYGIGGLTAAVDSGFVEALVVAGFIGVGCLAIVCCSVARDAWVDRAASDGLGPVYVALTIAFAVLTVGFPILTGNRSTLIIWLLLAVLLTRNEHQNSRDVVRQVEPARLPGCGRPSRSSSSLTARVRPRSVRT